MCLFTGILQSADESLFRYNPGENFATFYTPSFIPMFEPIFTNSTLEQLAREVCGDDENCLFDIAATKTIEIGMATMVGGNDFDEIVKMAVPGQYCKPALLIIIIIIHIVVLIELEQVYF